MAALFTKSMMMTALVFMTILHHTTGQGEYHTITNYLASTQGYSKASLYADDIALVTSAETQVDIMLNLNIELSIVNEWLKANKL